MGFALPLAIERVLLASSSRARWGWSALVGLFALALLFTYTRGAWIASLFSLVLLCVGIVLRRANRRAPRLASSLSKGRLVFLVCLFVPVVFGLTYLALPALESRYVGSDLFRLDVFKAALMAFSERPILGSGPDGFGLATMPFIHLEVVQGVIDHAHNMYLNVLVELGIVGFLAMAGTTLWVAVQAWRALMNSADDRSYYRILAATAGVTALAVHSLFNSFLHTPGVWLMALISVVIAVPWNPAAASARWPRWSSLGVLLVFLALMAGVAYFESAEVEQEVALAEAQKGNFAAAADHLEVAVARDPSFDLYYIQLGQVYQLLSQETLAAWSESKSRASYEAGMRRGTQFGLNLARLASSYVATGENELALDSMHQATLKDPTDYRLQVGYGALLEASGDWEAAMLAYARAIVQRPEAASSSFWSQTEYRKANYRRIYEEALAMAKALPGLTSDAKCRPGDVAHGFGEIGLAAREYSAGGCDYGLGVVSLRQGDYSEADSYFKKTSQDWKFRAAGYLGLGQSALASGKLADAERYLRISLFVLTDMPYRSLAETEAYYWLGRVYETRGDFAGAVKYYSLGQARGSVAVSYERNVWHRQALKVDDPAWLRNQDIVRSTPDYQARQEALQRAWQRLGR
ncbi:MAG: O-antigen ligase family protein [Chloroflexota bacterium]